MTLILRNLQNVIKFNLTQFKSDVNLLRTIANVESYDLGVLCTSNEYIQELNLTYRNINKPTDVLSFPFHDVSQHTSD